MSTGQTPKKRGDEQEPVFSVTDGPPMTKEELLNKAYSVDDEGIETFDLDVLVPPNRQVKIDGRVYKIPPEIQMPMVMKFVSFEQKRARMTSQDGQQRVLLEMEKLLVELLREYNDDVPGNLHLGVQRIPYLITHLMGGRSATESVLDVLSGGELRNAEEAVRNAIADAEKAGLIEADSDSSKDEPAPLASAKRSSRRSSRSPKSTNGRRSGGAKSATGRSAPTSRRRVAKA